MARAAGAEVLARAKAWLADHTGHGETIEDAVRVVLASDAGLAKRYLGFP